MGCHCDNISIIGGIDDYLDGLVQDSSISTALAMEILQSCTNLLIYWYFNSSSENMVGP